MGETKGLRGGVGWGGARGEGGIDNVNIHVC